MKSPNKPKTKTILFTRHAIALDQDLAAKQNFPDPKRELTPSGIKKFQRYVKKHKKLFKNVDSFLTSPYIRAKQTLALIMEMKSAKKYKPKVYKHIRPDDSPMQFIKYIMTMNAKKLIAVSHEPYMSHFMNALLGAQWTAAKIKKGHVIKIQIKKNGKKISYKMY